MTLPVRVMVASHVAAERQSARGPRIAYVLGRAPQPTSTFTNDEIAALDQHVSVVRCGLVADALGEGWHIAPGLRSAAVWRAVGAWLIRRPLRLLSAIKGLILPSLTAPHDAAVALRSAFAAAYLARRIDVDVIHAQFAGPAAAGAFVWHALTGTPYTIRAHAYDIYRPYRWAGRVMQSSSSVFAISEHGARDIRRRWGIEASVLRVGVAAESVAPREDRPPSLPLRVLSVGALEPKKGHEILIAAVRQANLNERAVTLDIYGEGSLRHRLRQLADGDGVTLKGYREPDDLRQRYREYDAFALAATTSADGDIDGIPVVLMEASLASVPVVTTNVGGIPELIEHGVTGWSVDANEQQIAEALRAVARDYAAARRRAAQARERVLEHHDLRLAAKRLAMQWSSLLPRTTTDPE